ncbi:hypothetical protein OE88DRAFT_1735116 [Heliocybe sulcata]|uniref:Uncharacterized protein n=1 Tax=Heliocybe sulcata TaxID=5364 RepID=A0A5C3N428_9AGAM|nr:hypothetical protein OE88DRAFT_1735116 [Heliocybe sulcata]
MANLQRPEDFEIDGKFGRCLICTSGPASIGKGWTAVKSLPGHEKQQSHQTRLGIRMDRLETERTESERHRQQKQYTVTIEDVPDLGDDWINMASDTDRGTNPADLLPLSEEMQAAISGEVAFTAGSDIHNHLAESLEEALSGVSLFEAAVGGWQGDDEAPLPDGLFPEDEDDLLHADSGTDALTAQEIAETYFGGGDMTSNFFPYPNKAMMKTDILFSSPRLRFSRAQQQAVLTWARDLGAKNIPSLHALHKFQSDGLEVLGNPTVKVRSASGNIFYMNKVTKAVAKDYAHPETRRLIHAYPEYTPNAVSEVWQAEKWLCDAPDHVLTPMIRLGNTDFYVKELTRCHDGSWFIPTRFFEHAGKMLAVGHDVVPSSEGLVVADNKSIKQCDLFERNWPEIEASYAGQGIFAESSQLYAAQMPNPDRATANGLEWECPPIVVFIDDVSGNSTKQWNVHYSCYMSNGGLPRSAVEKEINTKFVATSPYASPMEIIQAVCETLQRTRSKEPIKTWDSVRQRHILIRPWLLFVPGDNPMQAEVASHVGLNGNHFCRRCHVGGPKEFKESDEGYPTLLYPGLHRKAEETRNAILSHMIMATRAGAEKGLKDAVTSTGVKDSFATPIISRLIQLGKVMQRGTDLRKALSPEDVNAILTDELKKYKDLPTMNPLLLLDGFDVHKDTPVEPLHTHLLGIVKYFWGQTVWVLEKQGQFHEFQARLNSINQTGLNIPNIMADYMCRYSGGLIGKHFKTISQVTTFAIAGLVEPKLQNAWDSIGHLTTLIWETDIVDLKVHLDRLRSTIDDVLDSVASCSPALLTNKAKPHILSHIMDDVRRFGPAVLFSTERYEKFNRVFRLCSIHSNRQAPSRNIAATFAQLERCRHIVTGHNVLEHIRNNAQDATLLGVAISSPQQPSTTTLFPLPKSMRVRPPPLSWEDTTTYRAVGDVISRPPPGSWNLAKSFVTLNGDIASNGDEVLVEYDQGQETSNSAPLRFARVQEILSAADKNLGSCVVIEESTIESQVHPTLHLPVIRCTGNITTVGLQRVRAVVNVQHDCWRGSCKASNSLHVRQEREETTRTKAVVEHSEYPYFLVNIYSLHNNALLRAAVPPDLWQRPPLFTDRNSLHRAAAASLRDDKLQKKLAKDAAIRKQAETARLAASALGMLDDGDRDGDELHEEPVLVREDLQPLQAGTNAVTEEAAVQGELRVGMRGPRGRRSVTQVARGRGKGKPPSTAAVNATVTPRHVAGEALISGVPAEASSLLTVSAVQPGRKRRRAAADPEASARREAELRDIFPG